MPTGRYFDILKNRGFFCFFCTQFLGAFNDNFYKIIITLVALDIPVTAGGGTQYIPLIGGLFILPFFLFSGYAGYLADVYSKRNILVAVKVFEIFAMALGLLAFFADRIEPMLAVVFLMGLHSTFFSPAKYGILPEMLPDKDLSRGNGLLEMSTFLAIILGTSVGGAIYEAWKDRLGWIGVVLIVIAVLGTLTSLGITKVRPSGAVKKFVLNPLTEVWQGTKQLYVDQPLWLTVMGISYFWFLGAFLQMVLPLFGKEILQLGETRIGLLWTFAALGIGVGSLAAGRLSGDKVELGLVPIGSIGMGIFSIVLFVSQPSFAWAAASLVCLGFSGGFFAVPLNALLQQRSGPEDKGRLIATNNVFNTIGMLLASAMLWLLGNLLGIPADRMIIVVGLLTFVMTAYAIYHVPDFFVRFILWVVTHSLFRIHIVGQENIPERGPALLISNHVSFADALLIGASLQGFVRFMLHRDIYESRWLNWFFRLMKSIPVSATNRRDIVQSIHRARQELQEGHVVCIFAEGAISRTGHVLPFKRGFEKIVEKLDVPIIPVHLDQLWGSIFSFKDGRFFWKWPKRVPYPVTISFGAPLPPSTDAQTVRQVVLDLESQAAQYRPSAGNLLHTQFIRTAKRRWFSFCLADTAGVQLSYGKVLIGSVLLARWLQKHSAKEPMVGILAPASVGGALANIAVLLVGKVPVNLNFTAGREAMASAIQQCGIATILTSRLFLSKINIDHAPGMVFLEDISKTFSPLRKLLAAVAALALPAWLLERRYKRKQKPQDLATVIFSSGSTGTPKGVMLSHRNIISNIESMCQVIQFRPGDRIMGVLPLFHSFGFAVTLWLPLIEGLGAVYHPNPMDAKTIGETVRRHQATLLISTPTFYATYIRRCSAEEFASLRYAISGAEKLREQIAKDFKDKFGLELLEGYGCTELSPVVSVNLPDVIDGEEHQVGNKPGTVGHPLPAVVVKVVDPDTGRPLPQGEEGMLLVTGPNRMLGYLGEPKLTEQVTRDGWYVTGDIASLDEDGFIRITDRLSRFSKIGGEMVPHMQIEENINKILGSVSSVITSISDEHKGEKLIAFYTENGIRTDELWEKLNQSDLPKLWIPKRENFFLIESIPVLGSGKVDLKNVKRLAVEKASETKR
ncbi:MAG TPA: acyl-[ACP]--phospholipid O-acyltransferase [Methylomirabilota bacterium]|nr:acyl-[ACP]--phospholipid O-acyltransferase [Methylomirabilota bacterium]